jgi:hypothetical protein
MSGVELFEDPVSVSVVGDVLPPEDVPEFCDLVGQLPVLTGFFEPVADVGKAVGEIIQRVAFQCGEEGDVGVQGPPAEAAPGRGKPVLVRFRRPTSPPGLVRTPGASGSPKVTSPTTERDNGVSRRAGSASCRFGAGGRLAGLVRPPVPQSACRQRVSPRGDDDQTDARLSACDQVVIRGQRPVRQPTGSTVRSA